MKKVLVAVIVAVGLLGAFFACGNDDDSCPVGSERCPCTTGGACNAGLECRSGLCVETSSGADADAEAEADVEPWDGTPACDPGSCISQCQGAGHLTGECRDEACFCADT